METIRGNTLGYWKQNAEENYITTPISVLKYITILEELNQVKNLNQPVVSGMAVKEGDFAMVFDADKWHGDRGDNSEFWKKGKVLKVYWYDAKIGSSDWVVDVQFDDGRISKAHFLKGIKPCPNHLLADNTKTDSETQIIDEYMKEAKKYYPKKKQIKF